MQIPALMIIKLSFLALYRRVLRGKAFNIVSWILIGLVWAWAVAFFIAELAACGKSIRANFSSLATIEKECVNTFAILLCLSVFDVLVDLGIMILPMPVVF